MIAIPEILSPAGDFERLKAAVLYGADAVYLGGKTFGMRSSAPNFDGGELVEAVRYCHDRGVRVYVTCNTLPTVSEADELPDFIRQVDKSEADALIVADIGVLMLAKRTAPRLDIHISTQAGVVNHLTATELYKLGASRVVLAREVPLSDIKILRDKTPPELEIEAFIHGAMCVSFSGRCLLSNYLISRDANRGECAQPCRWGYHLVEEKRPGLHFPIFEDERGTYILNAKDLCTLPYIDKLAQAGINSFKIEGRAKSVYYVAAITGTYRKALDLYRDDPTGYAPPEWLLEEPYKVSHREYSPGFYFPDYPVGQYYEQSGYVRDWEVVATVDGWENGQLICTERNRFTVGETLEILSPDCKPEPFLVRQILDVEGNSLETACHPMMKIYLQCEKKFPSGSMLRRKTL